MVMMMMPTLGPEIFTRGFRFDPSPLEVVTYYLPRLLAGAPLHESVRPVVHHADVYACAPGDLARMFFPLPRTGHRFFFTYCRLQQPHRAGKASRATRAAGPGSWHSQGFTDIMDQAKVKVGEIRKLRYKKGGAYTDWLMDEYSMCGAEDAVAGGDRQFVFCNIYVSPRAAPDSPAHQESAAFFSAHPAPAPVVIAQPAPAAPPKKPAPEISEPPCPKRMRGAVALTPPVVPPGGYCTTSFAQPRSCVPNHGVPAPPVMWSPPAPAPTPLAAPPLPHVQHMQQMPTLTPSVVRPCHVPPQACMPQGGGVAPSSTPMVMATRSPPPAPAPTRPAVQPSRSPAPTPTPPRSPPKQQMPPPPPVLVGASHIPVQAPALHCRPAQPSVQRTRDPFEAAELGDEDEAEEQRVAAAAEAKESPAALQDDDDFAKFIEDAMATVEAAANSDGSTMTDEEMDQHLLSLFEDETLVVPKEEIP